MSFADEVRKNYTPPPQENDEQIIDKCCEEVSDKLIKDAKHHLIEDARLGLVYLYKEKKVVFVKYRTRKKTLFYGEPCEVSVVTDEDHPPLVLVFLNQKCYEKLCEKLTEKCKQEEISIVFSEPKEYTAGTIMLYIPL